MSVLFDLLNSINTKSVEYDQKEIDLNYVPFIINKGLSQYYDTIFLANEMNMYAKSPKWYQYMFYYHGVDKKKRYGKWAKKSDISNIDIVKEYFGYSDVKAIEALKVLSDSDIELIKERLFKGGK